MKLVVEVLDASNLMPKDGAGSASPYAEVDFASQRHRTRTVNRDLSPQWNEPLVFDVPDNKILQDTAAVVDVSLYHDRAGAAPGTHTRNFLGRVRLAGESVAPSPDEAQVMRYPLEKRGIFSHIRGEIALRVYAVDDEGAPAVAEKQQQQQQEEEVVVVKEKKANHSKKAETAAQPKESFESVKDNIISGLGFLNGGGGGDLGGHAEEEPKKPKPKKKNNKDDNNPTDTPVFDTAARVFHSIAAASADPPPVVTYQKSVPAVVQANYARPEPPPMMMHMHGAHPPPPRAAGGPMPMPMMMGPTKPPDMSSLVETKPPLAGRVAGYRGDKIASTYDLVEQMQYLYVNVVKARDLPAMDITGSIDPYVEVRLGNYRGHTKVLEKNHSPVWNQVFAFSKERVQSNLVEVVVKDKDLITKDDFVGVVRFDLTDVPIRVPPDSPLAPQWYRLEGKRHGEKLEKGEVMLSVWVGTQADESFPEAWHSDAHAASLEGLANTRSKVYFSPKLCYIRVHIIGAQDLVPGPGRAGAGGPMEVRVRVGLGNQVRMTRPVQAHYSVHPMWEDEMMFVASDPFDEPMILLVEDRVAPGKDEVLGRVIAPVGALAVPRLDYSKPTEARWFSLDRPEEAGGGGKKDHKFSSKIHVRITRDMAYHVLDESAHYSSDLRPFARNLQRPSIGVLEVGILSARNLMPMKGSGRTTDAYCVAKYGPKWVRTRTLLDTLHPRWNEQYTWEVFDPCTVITIGVFDNCHLGKDAPADARDQRIGKVRIRLSTLEADRIYTHFYPLLVLQPSGLKKTGELHLAVRFTCTAWVNMVSLYAKPSLPKMHYIHPIPVLLLDQLRHNAMQIVATRLGRAEPPLRRECVEYMLDVDSHMWSLRRSKANFHRITSVLSGVAAVARWLEGVCSWRNPITTILVHVLFLILVCYPELILPTIFLYLFMIGIWNYRRRPTNPPHMDARLSHAEGAHPDELDEEFDNFPSTRHPDLVRIRYERLRSVAGRVQTVVGDLATQGERALSLLSWRDPRATAIFILLSLVLAVVLYVTPFQVIAVLVGLYWLRHPRFRSRMPSVPFNFYRRLPARSDMLL